MTALMLGATCCAAPAEAGSAPAVVGLPTELNECETSSAGSKVCGTWTWDNVKKRYTAAWQNGSRGSVTVAVFNSCAVRLTSKTVSGHGSSSSTMYLGKWNGSHIVDGSGHSSSSRDFTWTATTTSAQVVTLPQSWQPPASCRDLAAKSKVPASPTLGGAVAISNPQMQAAIAGYKPLLDNAVKTHQITAEQAKQFMAYLADPQHHALTPALAQGLSATPPPATPAPGQFIDPNLRWPSGAFTATYNEIAANTKAGASHDLRSNPQHGAIRDQAVMGGVETQVSTLLTWSYCGNKIAGSFPRDFSDPDPAEYLGLDERGSYFARMQANGYAIFVLNAKTNTLTWFSAGDDVDGHAVRPPGLDTTGSPDKLLQPCSVQ